MSEKENKCQCANCYWSETKPSAEPIGLIGKLSRSPSELAIISLMILAGIYIIWSFFEKY